jgi:hypothetical protein
MEVVRLLIVASCIAGSGILATAEPWRCPAKPVAPCFKHHGRLSSQNGVALTIWLIGTKRIVALDNGIDNLPAALQKYLDMTSPDHSFIYGDFDICPTGPDVPGHMPRVCVAGAEKLVVQDVRGRRPPFRVTSSPNPGFINPYPVLVTSGPMR